MEITIGIQHTAREIAFETEADADTVLSAVQSALEADNGVVDLTDTKGRRYLIPAASLSYIELGEPPAHRIGFGA
ncbi:MAG: DUF3107 domain-containing protein [Microbacteriaceae bacterium]|jgi:hypothetical protein|nr:DUF3107 domain-containing protein [Microbacteriaceae bacterium]